MTNLWSAQIRIGPLRFQAGYRKNPLNLAWDFLCLFYVVVHFFWLVNACFCCVRFSFSIPSQEIGLGLVEHLRNDLLCVKLGVKPWSINQSITLGLWGSWLGLSGSGLASLMWWGWGRLLCSPYAGLRVVRMHLSIFQPNDVQGDHDQTVLYLCFFCVIICPSLLLHICFCCVGFIFLTPGRMSPKSPLLFKVRR